MIAFRCQGAAFSLERHLTNAIIRCRAYPVGARRRSDKELAAVLDDAYAIVLSNNYQMSTHIEDVMKDWSRIHGTIGIAVLFIPVVR